MDVKPAKMRGIPSYKQESTTSRVPPPPGRGTPPKPGQTGGGYPRWGTPSRGTPLARSDGGYPRWGTPWQGYPPAGVPPSDLPGVPPLSGPGRGTPPGVDRQMDRHVSKHNLPVVLRTRSAKIQTSLSGNCTVLFLREIYFLFTPKLYILLELTKLHSLYSPFSD